MNKRIEEIREIANELVNRVHNSRTMNDSTINELVLEIINNRLKDFDLDELKEIEKELKPK